jgi:hypothetical protein
LSEMEIAHRVAKGERTGSISTGKGCVMLRADTSGCHGLESGRRVIGVRTVWGGQMEKGWMTQYLASCLLYF